jgi:RNA polymerase sigma-B factor
VSKRAQPFNNRKDEILSLISEFKQNPNDESIIIQLYQKYEKLINNLASCYAIRNDIHEDLVQVGRIGLFAAITRFDPKINKKFESFAIPTIKGEMKRYLRDKTWSMRVPRKYKDLSYKLKSVVDELTVELERAPLIKEIAEKMSVSEEDVLQTMEASSNYRALSVDQQVADTKAGRLLTLIEKIPSNEKECIYEKTLNRIHINTMLQVLSEREKDIIYYLYFEQLSQAQVGKKIGISQMHVSRLHRQAIRKLNVKFSHLKNYY